LQAWLLAVTKVNWRIRKFLLFIESVFEMKSKRGFIKGLLPNGKIVVFATQK